MSRRKFGGMQTTFVEDPKLAALAREYAEKAEPLPEGRSGVVTAACRAATIHRIITGKALTPPNGPCYGSRTWRT